MHGINTLVDRNFLSELLGTNLLTGAAYALVITSALACLLAFFGFFAAAREIKCMLLTVSKKKEEKFIQGVSLKNLSEANSKLTTYI